MSAYFARHALLVDGWARDVRIVTGPGGTIESVASGAPREGATVLEGIVLPGIPNAHSHAFQREMAGRAEVSSGEHDTFWTWREEMYASIATIGPDAFEAVTTEAFRSMRVAGYTRVCEFHYVHNNPDGAPYDDPNELAHRVVAAARAAGIGLTLLPVLYQFSDFNAKPPEPRQRRFIRSIDAYVAAWQTLAAAYRDDPNVVVGVAPHSLRAVGIGGVKRLTKLGAAAPGRRMPFHIHLAEQVREVEACVAAHGTTPVNLLTQVVALDDTWCLVHLTHATAEERAIVSAAKAVVSLCPTTEANLGDGIFPAADFIKGGGRFAIGTDSNITLDLAEELRWLEYVQRLARRERNVLSDAATASVARYMWTRAAKGGAQAAGIDAGWLVSGARADFIALDAGESDDPDVALGRAVFRSGSWKLNASVVAGVLA